MPTYAFHCRACDTTFDVARPMAQANAPASCPDGHEDTVKLLTTVGIASTGSAPSPAPAGGGCCGGACGCGH
ncbi:zinc ribbon domain-containing protein [Actinobacteria bacterium YIM 96077]|uniref:Zinc ribbon domain-containing protein n=1 Tax=Phytoactinopolyspora halophila TaxID=1981511 RepID=A0A329R537_9ACTN|nr:zinc ribbon domain-containing protein [Actinobacteria bacterium YIM 96077]RAW18178.1 zinc ribbon domain-containing protein [Phytoactinopolyspora halophila]